MDVLRNSRLSNPDGVKSPGTEDVDDDGLDHELSRLEEAEQAMRDELAAAVMDFGLSLPTSPSAGGDAGGDADATVGVTFGDQDEDGEGNSDHDESEEKLPSQDVPMSQEQQRGLSGSSFPTDNNSSPEKISAMRSNDARVRSESDTIDEHELYAALTDLCGWIREGASMQLQHQEQKEQAISSPYRRHQYSPVRDGGLDTRRPASVRRPSPKRVDITSSPARRRPPANKERKPTNLRELEKNLPVDDLCRWLKEGLSPKYACSASNGQKNQTFDNSVVGSDPGNQTETPNTFHVPSVTGTSSLLVLGSAAVGNTVRPPQGRSPLRKTHC